MNDDELEGVEARAIALLEHPERAVPHDIVMPPVEMRLWHYPSFKPWTCWALFKAARDESSVFASRIVWDRVVDLNQRRTQPTLAVQYVIVDEKEIKSRLSRARILKAAVAVDSHIALDGETFGIEFGFSGLTSHRLEWWGDGPAEWREVVSWAEGLRGLLDRWMEARPFSVSPLKRAWQLRMNVTGVADDVKAMLAIKECMGLNVEQVARAKDDIRQSRSLFKGTYGEMDQLRRQLGERGVDSMVVSESEG